MEKWWKKEKVVVGAGVTVKDLMAQGLSKSTAYRAVKRGYYFPDYHKKVVVIGNVEDSMVREWYKIANIVFYKCFYRYGSFWQEDLVQEGVLRCFELSGISQDFSFLYKTVVYAMKSFVERYHLCER